jgi:hypothetical protein
MYTAEKYYMLIKYWENYDQGFTCLNEIEDYYFFVNFSSRSEQSSAKATNIPVSLHCKIEHNHMHIRKIIQKRFTFIQQLSTEVLTRI